MNETKANEIRVPVALVPIYLFGGLDTIFGQGVKYEQHLENCTDELHVRPASIDSPLTLLPTREGSVMGRIRREYIVGTDAQGEAIKKWLSGNTEQEIAEEAAKIMLAYGKVNGMKACKEDTPFFNDFARDWFLNIRKPSCPPHLALEGAGILRNYVYPFFEGKRLGEIRSADITRYLSQEVIQRLARSTASKHVVLLKMIFSYAVEGEFIDKSPVLASCKKYLPKRKQNREALTTQERKELLDALPSMERDERLYYSFAFFCGLRRGEILGLKRKDIEGNKLRVERSVVYVKGKSIVKEPKTNTSIRFVPMPNEFPFHLLEGMEPEDFILGGEEPWTEGKLRGMYKRIRKRVPLFKDGAKTHVLRHTFATVAITRTDPKTVQHLLGHATADTTMNIYAHVQKERLEGVNLDGLYGVAN